MKQRKTIAMDAAQVIALQALAHIASDDASFGRFLDLTGLKLDYLKQRADERDVQAAVLYYLCRNERDLLRFCGEIAEEPSTVMSALRLLAPDLDMEMSGEQPSATRKREKPST